MVGGVFRKEDTISTALYVIGFAVLIAGLAWAASALGVQTLWITIGVVIVAGVAIIGLAGNLQQSESERRPPP